MGLWKQATLLMMIIGGTAAAASQCLPTQWTSLDQINFKQSLINHHGIPISLYSSAPRSFDAANVIYIHNLGGAVENHRWLFKDLYEAKIRVLAFDLPGHGKSKELNLHHWNFNQVAQVIKTIQKLEGDFKLNPKIPTILVGWGHGGTLALRALQSGLIKADGVVGLAPGLSWQEMKGERSPASLRPEMLSSCLAGSSGGLNQKTTFHADFKQFNNLEQSVFHKSIKEEGGELEKLAMPTSVPSLVILSKPEDEFVMTEKTVDWVYQKNAQNKKMRAIECREASHALEFEPGITGQDVRSSVVKFTLSVARGRAFEHDLRLCQLIK